VQALIAALAPRGKGRKGFGARALVGACLVKALFGLPTWTRVAALIAEHPGLQASLGGAPSCWACYRFTVKLRENQPALADCLDAVTAALHAQDAALGENVAIDGTDLPAYANGQRFVRRNGPERERFSDSDASWGHRSAVSTRAGGGYYGFKLHLLSCTRTGLPLAWEITTARESESRYVAPLLDTVHRRGFRPETAAMDKGYDGERVHAECETRGIAPVIPMRGAKGKQTRLPVGPICRETPRIPRHTERFRTLYRGRSAVEREFGRLKHDYGLAPLRVRGLERVRLHADLTMLGRLGLAMIRARELAVAA
jgi:transposase